MSTTVTPSVDKAEAHDRLEAVQLWSDAVTTITAKAYESMPDEQQMVRDAYTLVMDGRIEPTPEGAYRVRASDDPDDFVVHVGKHCDCPHALVSAGGLCVHKLAVGIYRRAKHLLARHDPLTEAEPPVAPTAEPTLAPAPVRERVTIPEKYMVNIKGTPAVKFAGLLYIAHERGLLSLSAQWTHNDADLSLAHATATFKDGRTFSESGDASPSNVNQMVSNHFRRVALTRAKARVLRDALGVDLVAAEELAD